MPNNQPNNPLDNMNFRQDNRQKPITQPTGQRQQSQEQVKPVRKTMTDRPVTPEYKRPPVPTNLKRRKPKTKKQKPKVLGTIGKIAAFVLTFNLAVILLLYCALGMMCSNRVSKEEKEKGAISEILYITVPTFLETGQFKFIPSLYLSKTEIQNIVDKNKMKDMDANVDENLINIGDSGKKGTLDINPNATENNENNSSSNTDAPIEIHEVSGATYYGTMMVVKDPSRVSIASIYPWKSQGITLEQLVKDNGAVGGINGGLYNSYNNSGGAPYGVLVCNGEIQHNRPQEWPGLVLVGFTEDNILQIIDVSKMNSNQVKSLVAERKIRDAVTFQDEASDSNNHFVQLIINGETREMNGMGSGLNPRTAIGQRADGAVLMFVTDGRAKNGHLGASASDLIEVMKEFGAVNAANLDGGSSSCMYYEDKYLMDSVTFAYSNTSWRLPAGFVVK